jgi:hypothetical protein
MRNFMKGDPRQAEIPLTDIIMVGDRRIDESGDSNPAPGPSLPISGNSESWRILLIELVHILALFFTHAAHARRARVTAVMFDQIMRRLNILDKMPGHEDGLIIRRIGHSATTDIGTPDYFMLFGELAFCGAEAFGREQISLKRPAQLSRSLEQAFACFHNHGIHALYLQFPPKKAEKIDQLQLALNIVARFHRAVANNASITFRYFGHALTIPLIQDTNGRPDPNLTVLAGLNGLSALNMRKLIQQADAFHKMSRPDAADDQQLDNYNSIFRLPSLRSQLIKPLLEINNLPWIPMEVSTRPAATPAEPVCAAPPAETTPAVDLQKERSDSLVEDAVTALFGPDFDGQNAEGLGQLLGALSGMLRTLDTTDPPSMERVLGFLHGRLEQLPEDLLSQLELRRQGIKINYEGRSVLLGMVHPRLLHLITLIKEQLSTHQKRAALDACFSDLTQCDHGRISERFHLTLTDTDALLELLKSCLNIGAGFDHAKCLHHLDALADYGETAFEMLWCLLRHRPNDQERLQMLNILALLAMRVENRVPLLSFLLSDLMRKPDSLQDSDRQAFTLAAHMLRTAKSQDRIDSEGTPESVLALRSDLDEHLRRHVAWRLDSEQARVLFKFETIRNAARVVVQDAAATAPGSAPQLQELLFLEREGLLFLSLAQGETARAVMRDALAFYGDPGSAIYQCRMKTTDLSALMGHLAVLLKAMARLGQPRDIKRLTALEQSASRFMAMDTDPAHKRRVKQTLQWVAPAIRSIQVQWKKM